MTQCPKCGGLLDPATRKCAQCGWVEVGGTPPQTSCPGVLAASATETAAARASAEAAFRRTRRVGNRLLIPSGSSVLPPFCIRCGQPGTVVLTRRVQFANSNLRRMVLPLLVIFYPLGLVALVVSGLTAQDATLDIPLCEAHCRARSRWLWTGVALMVAAIPLGILAGTLTQDTDWGALPGLALGLVLLIVGTLLWRHARHLLWITRMDDIDCEVAGLQPVFFTQAEPFLRERSAD